MKGRRNPIAHSLHDRAALRWVEVLLSRGESDAALAWMAEVERGIPDEGAMADACARLDGALAEIWETFRATVYRHGKRVIMPSNPCLRSWAQDRPCTLAAGHNGPCPIADVPVDVQLANLRTLAEELGAVTVAVALPGSQP